MTDRALRIWCLVAALLSGPAIAGAQDTEGDAPEADFALPVEFDFDFGAANGRAVIARLVPLIAAPLGRDWRLESLTLGVVAKAPGGVPGRPGNPNPVAGGDVFGLGDLTTGLFFVPPPRRAFVWGFGFGVGFPTATDDRLGSGKWSAGPAFRVAYRRGPWNIGALIVDLGSFAGDRERRDIHQLLVRGLIRRQLGGPWYFTNSPIITANWKAQSGTRWLIPLGGGIGRRFTIGSRAFALAVHGYAHVVKPDGAPKSLVRLDAVFPIPIRVLK